MPNGGLSVLKQTGMLNMIQNYTINKYIYINVYQLVFRYLYYLGQQIYQIRNTLLSGQVSCFRHSQLFYAIS